MATGENGFNTPGLVALNCITEIQQGSLLAFMNPFRLLVLRTNEQHLCVQARVLKTVSARITSSS